MTPPPISCPHCTGRGTCCVCQGTRRVEASPDHLAWLWEYAGCPCDACGQAKAQRLEAGVRVTLPRPLFVVDPSPAWPPGWGPDPCVDCGTVIVTINHGDGVPTRCAPCASAYRRQSAAYASATRRGRRRLSPVEVRRAS